jgi:hypothetical protein
MVLLLFEVAHSQIVLASINIENSARPQHSTLKCWDAIRRRALCFSFSRISRDREDHHTLLCESLNIFICFYFAHFQMNTFIIIY